MNQGLNSYSNKKIKYSPLKRQDLSHNKSHAISSRDKIPQDPYSHIYRLPLKQIVKHIKEEERSYSKKKSKPSKTIVEPTFGSNFKTKPLTSRKHSIHKPSESTELKSDLSSKSFKVQQQIPVLKRIKTQQESLSEEIVQTVPYQKSTPKKPKKQFMSVKVEHLMKLLTTYAHLKSTNERLTKEISFYYEHEPGPQEINSVLKVLRM